MSRFNISCRVQEYFVYCQSEMCCMHLNLLLLVTVNYVYYFGDKSYHGRVGISQIGSELVGPNMITLCCCSWKMQIGTVETENPYF